MKIEKLTENKIRVIVNANELGLSNMNAHNIMTKAIETQDIFSNILKEAEKTVDFCTDGCKLLIETFSSLDDILVFTITKYSLDNDFKKKKLVAKRKSFDNIGQKAVCYFENFNDFCKFCNAIKNIHKFNNDKLIKTTTLYLWKDSYYLILKNLNTKCENISLFCSTLSEFGKLLSSSNSFECKLLEHGKVIIKKNAVDIGAKLFVD